MQGSLIPVLNTVVKRDTSVLYYDCTNFYFECEKKDDAVVDEVTGEVMCGLRKYGVSKEHMLLRRT